MTAIPTIIFLTLVAAGTVAWIWSLVDVLRRPQVPSPGKGVWVVILVFTNVIGAVLYLTLGRRAEAGA